MNREHRAVAAGRKTGLAVLGLASCLIVSITLTACQAESEDKLLASARDLLGKKDVAGATLQLKNALQGNPNSGEARLLLGTTLLSSGDPAGALVELRKAEELSITEDRFAPEMARALLATGNAAQVVSKFASTVLKEPHASADLSTSLATAYASQRAVTKAEEAAARALAAERRYAPALVLQAKLKASQGELDAALFLLSDLLSTNPDNEGASVLKAQIQATANHDMAGALKTLQALLVARPGSVLGQIAVVNLLNEEGRTAEARQQFDSLKKIAPEHPETLLLQAQFALADQDLKTAHDIMERLLKYSPDDPRFLELAGATEYRLTHYLQAESMLARALKAAPGLRVSRQLLAQTYLRMGQPAKAIDALQPLMEGAAADGVSLALAGDAWLQMGNTKKSEESFARAIQLAPKDPKVRTAAAIAQVKRGDSAAAIPELQAIAAEDGATRADMALITARLRTNDLEGALIAIDGLQHKLPDRALAYNLRGRVQLLQHKVAEATKSFETALVKDPKYFPAIASLAAIELQGGKPQLARKRLEDLLKAEPKNYRAMLALAELGARTGATPDDTVRLLREAVKATPAEAMPHLSLVAQLLSMGDAKAALGAAREAAAALPGNVQVQEALGRTQLATGDAGQAVATLKALSSAQASNVDLLLLLANACIAAKDNDAAARSLRRALDLQPESTAVRRGLVALAVANAKPQEAVLTAREIQRSRPNDALGYAIEGEVEYGRKAFDAAAVAFRAALERAKSPEVTVKLHQALVAGGKRAEADKLAEAWIKSNPGDATVLFYLGDRALDEKDQAAAASRYRQVLVAQPSNALAMNNLAWLMLQKGDPGAVAMAEKAVALLPGRAPLLDTLAQAQAAANLLPQAIETQKRAVASSPDDSMLKLALAKLFVKAGDKPRARAELEDLARLGAKFPAQAEVDGLLKSL